MGFFRLMIALGMLAMSMPLVSMTAAAHSPLASSSPSDGAVVASAPEAIEMIFRGKARLVRFRLTSADGAEVALGEDHLMVQATRHRVMVPSMGAGDFTARWRAMSEDGHVLKGDFSFRVGAE